MDFRKILTDFFSFTKRERIAIGVFFLLLLSGLAYRAWNQFKSVKKYPLVITSVPDTTNYFLAKREKHKQAFNFTESLPEIIDPNYASFNELIAIGLNKRQAATILKFRSSGGYFYFKQDLKRIRTIDSSTFVQISRYIGLKEKPVSDYAAVDTKQTPEKQERKPVQIIELNSADTVQLKSINGIGSYLANKIVFYREKLGGFISVNQLLEIRGMREENFNAVKDKLNVNIAGIRKIRINQADKDELSRHPYISYAEAKLLVNYRLQHGNYQNKEDLNNILGIEESSIERFLPYLSFE